MSTTVVQYETDYQGKFGPKAYLDEYFQEVDQTNHNVMQFIVETTKTYESILKGVKLLNFGCGPCVDTMMSFAPYCAEIHMSDYLAGNLAEVQSWVNGDPDAFNWDIFLRRALRLESARELTDAEIPASEVATRVALMRKKMTQFLVGNAQQSHPLGEAATASYDALGMFFCLEAAATNIEEWQQMVKNVFSLLKPNGLLVWVMTAKQSKAYYVGDELFNIVPLKESDIKTALEGIIIADSLKIQYFDVVEHEHVEGAYMVTALKAG
jgi:leucyl-tRNA synthetase